MKIKMWGLTNDCQQRKPPLDGVSKHRRWYNSEFFFGTAVIDQFTNPFEAKILHPRVNL